MRMRLYLLPISEARSPIRGRAAEGEGGGASTNQLQKGGFIQDGNPQLQGLVIF